VVVAISYSCLILQQLMCKIVSRRAADRRIRALARKIPKKESWIWTSIADSGKRFGHKLREGNVCGGIHAMAQNSTIPIALRTDCRTQKIKRFRFVALPEFIRTLLLAS
jgi:hypothetical protein